MQKFFITLFLIGVMTPIFGQSTGDTIVVKSLHHGSATRDTTVSFPTDQNLTFSKILLKYNMRCKDAKVSTGQNRNRGCGEWDYSCNTYIHEPSKIDSLLTKQISHSISGFSGDTFYYSNTPVQDYYLTYQTQTTIDSVISETISTVGTSSISVSNTFNTNKLNGKSQYLYTASELLSAGLTNGSIDGIRFSITGNNNPTDFLRIRIKATSDTALDPSNPHLNGFTEVYYQNTALGLGMNRIQFASPFSWNGTDNVIVEMTFSNAQSTSNPVIDGAPVASYKALLSSGDKYFYFNGNNYVEANQYKGISGNTARTVEAWIKTTEGGKEIVSWGRDVGSGKWNFRLESTGELRVEVNGGYKIGSTDLRDNEWHHVACVFSGTNVTDVDLYVDGVLEGNGGQLSKAINTVTSNGINVRISRGTNNRYFTGIIDEVRIWDTALTVTELQGWMHKKLSASHPKYANLQAWYNFNDGSGSAVADSSGNGNHASIIAGNQWSAIRGADLNKEMINAADRPVIGFYQGTYNLTNTTDTILDSVQRFQQSVTEYQIFSKAGTTQSDSIASTTTFHWQSAYGYIIDTNGTVLDSVFYGSNGNYVITTLDYFRRYPMRFEIMSFVTPYGIGLDFGKDGKTWTFDITDFEPILKGDKRMTMEWGGQWQEEMDIQFLFIVGTPPRDILNIDQIWRVTKPSYSAIAANSAYEPRTYNLLSTGKQFKIRSAITGHGQEGEFVPRTHYIDLNNGGFQESWQVWKACAANPVYPQGGTWIYDRAGWCPGMATDIRHIDITSDVTAGQGVIIDYGINFAAGASNYIVSNQIVTYGDANFSVDAEVTDILRPSNKVEYAKNNPICDNAAIVIRNSGSDALTSATIEYWINDETSPKTLSWTGNLGFMEEEEVELPTDRTFWGAMKADGNQFHARITAPNSSSDEYNYNDEMVANFELPQALPRDFVIWFRTNNAAFENKMFLYDSDGNEVFKRTNFTANTEYKDTLNLEPGCYTLRLNDSGNDGIDFWANNDGTGSLRLVTPDPPIGTFLKTFEGDFGAFTELQFTVDYQLSFEDIERIKDGFSLYPNPAEDVIYLETTNAREKTFAVYNAAGQLIPIQPVLEGDKLRYDLDGLNKGIYLIQMESKGEVKSKRFIVQ